MKKTGTLSAVIAAFILSATGLYSWTRTYGYDDRTDVGWCVRPTSDGGYIMSGQSSNNGVECMLVKTDRWGDSLWVKRYKGNGRYVVQTSDGGYIVAGNKDSEFWLLKTDGKGDSLWAKEYHGSDTTDYAWCVRQTLDDGYIVVGTRETDINSARGFLWLVRTNPQGDTIWTKTYKSPSSPPYYYSKGWSLLQKPDSGFVVSGLADGKIWLLRTDPLGDTLWTRMYANSMEGGHSVQPTSDGGYIIAGDCSTGGLDLYLVKTDSSGDTMWTRKYGSNNTDIGYDVTQTSDGGYIVTGTKNYEAGSLWLIKTDAYGDTIWSREYSGQHSGRGHSLCLASDDGYVICGCRDYIPASEGDMWLLKTNNEGDTVWFQASPAAVTAPEEGDTIHKIEPEAWFRNTGTMIADNFYCHCEISSDAYQSPPYHASYWISYPLELGDSVFVKFPEWVSDNGVSYAARFYTTCEDEPWWSCNEVTVRFTGSPTEDVEEQNTPAPVWMLLGTAGPSITLRYSNYPEGFKADVFDAAGRRVERLVSPALSGTLTWGGSMPSGVYFIRPLVGSSKTEKVVITR